MGDIHLDAAKVIHHIHQRLHVHRHIVIDGQPELVVDDIGQSGDAAAVGDRHRVDLIIRGGVGLSIGKGDLFVLSGDKAVAGDLQHPQRAVLDVELHVQDHIGHAVVGSGVVGIIAALFIVDAADQNVHHIALVFLVCLDLFLNGRGAVVRTDAVLHLVHKADAVHHHTGDHRDDGHDHCKRQPEGRFLFLIAATRRFALSAALCRTAGRLIVCTACALLCIRAGRGVTRCICRPLRALQRTIGIDMAWRLAHAFLYPPDFHSRAKGSLQDLS